MMSWTLAINHATVTTPILYASSVLTNSNGQAGNAMLYGATLICSLFFSTLIFGVAGAKRGLSLAMGLPRGRRMHLLEILIILLIYIIYIIYIYDSDSDRGCRGIA